MPTGKRASMREGPLASLFRKTAEDAGSKDEAPEQGAPTEKQPAEQVAPPPEQATVAEQPVHSEEIAPPGSRLMRGTSSRRRASSKRKLISGLA